MGNTLLIQRVANGFLVIPQHSAEDPHVFITLKECLDFIASQIGDMDQEFNAFEQEIAIVDKVHQA